MPSLFASALSTRSLQQSCLPVSYASIVVKLSKSTTNISPRSAICHRPNPLNRGSALRILSKWLTRWPHVLFRHKRAFPGLLKLTVLVPSPMEVESHFDNYQNAQIASSVQ